MTMKKIWFLIPALSGILLYNSCGLNKKTTSIEEAMPTEKFFDYIVNDIDGKPYKMADLKGKKVMIVNVASKCGFTPQYEPLQQLYEKYRDLNFVIIGFPANNFMSQEPGTEAEIKEFCSSKYNVTFPMMSKISVKGEDMHPLYQWLTQKSLNGIQDTEVKWNFQKYLVDENGKLVGVAYSRESPSSERIVSWIEKGIAPGFGN
jgi:glutathione peroxidase